MVTLCDKCNQKAYYTATKNLYDITFCGNHTRQHAPDLIKQGFTITPEGYNEFYAEQVSIMASPKPDSAPLIDEECEEVSDLFNQNKQLKEEFEVDPLKVITEVFIPAAQNLTNFWEPVKVIITNDLVFELKIERINNDKEGNNPFIVFRHILFQLMRENLK